jgi:oligoribonuclease
MGQVMEIDKKAPTTKLLWVDLEMTGLDVNEHVIIEIAAHVTDWAFNTRASYAAVINQPEEVLEKSNPWAMDQHTKSGLLDQVRQSEKSESDVIREVSDFIRTQFGNEPAVLAGNSIHNDRQFIKKWWPEVDGLLHYRMLDVSALKLIMQGKYNVAFEKLDTHLADEDIRASIAELEYYLHWFKDHSPAI